MYVVILLAKTKKKILHSAISQFRTISLLSVKDLSSFRTKHPSANFQLSGIVPLAQIFLMIFHSLFGSFGYFSLGIHIFLLWYATWAGGS